MLVELALKGYLLVTDYSVLLIELPFGEWSLIQGERQGKRMHCDGRRSSSFRMGTLGAYDTMFCLRMPEKTTMTDFEDNLMV